MKFESSPARQAAIRNSTSQSDSTELNRAHGADGFKVALLTGGADRPYAFGLALALASHGIKLEVVGNDELDCPELRSLPCLQFLNLRGNQDPDASLLTKAMRVVKYYFRLLRYTAVAQPEVFHILWNNKFEYFDRTILMLWYRLSGKRIVRTLHNVNSRLRDGGDTLMNRITLRFQYALSDHLFVHTSKMREELIQQFGIPSKRISVIPFGINNSVPVTNITPAEARRRLGIDEYEKALLFFGNIAPYKGLELLTQAFRQIIHRSTGYRLVIAGRPKNCEEYWNALRRDIAGEIQNGQIMLREDYIPDEETEVYFKACDVLVLPYRHIYQSGVLFLGYSFGLPVLASDVGSLKDDILEGKTGFVFRPDDPDDLAISIERYFSSHLYNNLADSRGDIRSYAEEKHSWTEVTRITTQVYQILHRHSNDRISPNCCSSANPLDFDSSR